jgi:hypothetical protein
MNNADAQAALNTIHALMCVPFDWSPNTLDDVALVLGRLGYTWPTEEQVDALIEQHDDNNWIGPDGVPIKALSPWRPAAEEK